jgi:ADP-ribose pyrophosphatase
MSRIRPWRLQRSQIVFDEPWYKLRRDWALLPDGQQVDDYYVSLRPEVVLIFAISADEEVILVRQYKHGAGEILLEFPGGTFVGGSEASADAAARELAEETGYTASQMQFLGAVWDDPTRQNNRIHLYLARGARLTQAQDLDDHEDIEVVKVPLRRLREMCLRGDIAVTGSIALAFRAFEALRER